MSVVISYVSDNTVNNISVIITDTRISYKKSGSNEIHHHDDNVEKLHNIEKFGWFAGTGNSDFLNLVYEHINNSNIDTLGRMTEIYKQLVLQCINDKLNYSENDVMFAKIIFSLPILYKEKQQNKLMIGFFNRNNNMMGINKNNIHVSPPRDYENNIDFIKSIEDNPYYHFDGDINKLLYKLVSIFKNISDKSNEVSEMCHIGILRWDNNILRKELIQDNAQELLYDIEKETIHSKIKTIY